MRLSWYCSGQDQNNNVIIIVRWSFQISFNSLEFISLQKWDTTACFMLSQLSSVWTLDNSCYVRRIDGIHTEFDTVEVVMVALCNQGVWKQI